MNVVISLFWIETSAFTCIAGVLLGLLLGDAVNSAACLGHWINFDSDDGLV